ncbi:hypothetical protein [Dokdonia sp. Hel_I_53]|uniref:hypothetical protein n=1 Tax=Dokdonia sp. Hel_I_53 TaxID=1566287 RepID=UPI0011999ACD|nr:hypothetical protein [Dokdonia sp. Hel_I_53]TVZ51491.1 hypothetical protein OD90_0634 [Dokdonia sp. Hel_I_53]
MKRILLILFTATFVSNCTTVKNTTARVNSGNYDEAIRISLSKLKKNPEKKGKQEYVLLLEEAFAKAKQRDTDRLNFLIKENQETNLEKIYRTYIKLEQRQKRIRPILPLKILSENRNANFVFENYDDELITVKDKLVSSLYEQSNYNISNATSKAAYRAIHEDLKYINELKPRYKKTEQLMREIHEKGTDFINVLLTNDTQIALPIRLEDELTDFSTYDLDDFWTVYHTSSQPNVNYDYEIQITFTEINISPESIRERELQKEKIVKDGTKFLKDDDGNFVYGEDGEKIEVDNMITVRSTYHEFNQSKAVNVTGRVRYINLITNQVMDTYPLTSEFVFDHRYATFTGDRRALEDDLYTYTRNRAVPFPTNEQMIYDAGEDLKNRIKQIIVTNKF